MKAAGAVIVRQRPGTAKGFVFLSLEDESGIVQAIVRPDLFRENRALIVGSAGLVVEGQLQKEGGNVSVRAERFWPLPSLPTFRATTSARRTPPATRVASRSFASEAARAASSRFVSASGEPSPWSARRRPGSVSVPQPVSAEGPRRRLDRAKSRAGASRKRGHGAETTSGSIS